MAKAVILAGGRGTRLGAETQLRPKPMVEIGGRPILWHIMKCYALHGIRDFVICLGYKGDQIKEFFLNYRRHSSDLTLDLATGTATWLTPPIEDWRVTLVDTGEDTQTGGRLRRVAAHLRDEDSFCLTYGDGVAPANATRFLDRLAQSESPLPVAILAFGDRMFASFCGYGDQAWSDSAVRRYVRDAGELLTRLHALTRSDVTTRNQRKADRLAHAYDDLEQRIAALQEQEELDSIRPDLSGEDIMRILGLKPGREVGEARNFLMELRLDQGQLGAEEAEKRLLAWWSAR